MEKHTDPREQEEAAEAAHLALLREWEDRSPQIHVDIPSDDDI